MKRFVLTALVLLLCSGAVYAGFGVGVYAEPSLLTFDGINSKTLERESTMAPGVYFGLQGVYPIFSGVFLSARAGLGGTLNSRDTATLPTGDQTVRTQLQELRTSLRLNLLFDNGVFLFGGGGYASTKLRFDGDIDEINADETSVFAEAGLGRMLNDKHFVGVSASFVGEVSTISLNYSFFYHYSGY